ncbi:MAG: hypothetical protein IKR09_02070 [Alphaproteobacteria bacterium]|nr:hypothetical protein [Alphaproteobacteria bacterium]
MPPYGAQILIAVSLAENTTPFDILKTMYYPVLVGVSVLIPVFVPKNKVF